MNSGNAVRASWPSKASARRGGHDMGHMQLGPNVLAISAAACSAALPCGVKSSATRIRLNSMGWLTMKRAFKKSRIKGNGNFRQLDDCHWDERRGENHE